MGAIVKEIFLQTNEMLPRGLKLRGKLFMKRGKTHRFIKEVLSEQSILLDGGAKLNISE